MFVNVYCWILALTSAFGTTPMAMSSCTKIDLCIAHKRECGIESLIAFPYPGIIFVGFANLH